MTYDKDRSNSLEPNELANFFNDVFEKMHNPDRFTISQAMSAMRMVDANFDGRASKQELFNALKYMMANPAGNAYVGASSSSSMSANNAGYSNQAGYGSSSTHNSYSNNINSNYQGQLDNTATTFMNHQQISSTHNSYEQQGQLHNTATSFLNPQPSSINTYEQGHLNNAASSMVGPYSGQPSIINNLGPSNTSTISQTSYSSSSYTPGTTSFVQNVPSSNTQVIYTSSTTPAPVVIKSTPLVASTVNEPGYTRVTTTTAPGYSKITTESYSSSTTYKY